MVAQKPSTASLTAARPMTGSAFAKRNSRRGEVGDELVGVDRVDGGEYRGYVTAHDALLHESRRAGTRKKKWPRGKPAGYQARPKVYAVESVCSSSGKRQWLVPGQVGFLVGQEGPGWRGAPQVRGDVPVAGHPAVVDLVDVGEPLDPRAPRIGVVVEEVRPDGVPAQAPARTRPRARIRSAPIAMASMEAPRSWRGGSPGGCWR